MGRHSTAITPEAPKLSVEVEILPTLTPPDSPSSKKRKRDIEPTNEIEVDINAPEPPSKKTLRKAKKAQSATRPTNAAHKADKETPTVREIEEEDGPEAAKSLKRSEYGIWIGNLSWMTTKNDLRAFFEKNMSDDGVSITRLHLPPPSQTTLMNSRQKIKPVNKGFAYVDFATVDTFNDALSLSEKLFSGRKVLIKDAKSFEGRPEKTNEETRQTGLMAGKPPGKRIFVGNLGYDTTRDDMREHFSRCGEVEDVFLTTFEDSGKCKGYGWVTFAETEAAQAAVRGWVDFVAIPDEEVDDEQEDSPQPKEHDNDFESAAHERREKPEKPKKPRKWWVNRFQGRALRMEFAEGKDVRYKKRYGKGGTAAQEEGGIRKGDGKSTGDESAPVTVQPVRENRFEEKKVDARTIKPGAALAAAPRLTGSIVESKGKKTTFG